MTVKDLRPALREYLHADAAIAAIVDGGSGLLSNARIYANVVPQGVREPCLVLNRISGLGDYHSQGASGLSRPRIQIDAWAPTADEAAQLSNLVKARIDGARANMPYGDNSPRDHLVVQGIFMDSEDDGYDPAVELYRDRRDYVIWFEER